MTFLQFPDGFHMPALQHEMNGGKRKVQCALGQAKQEEDIESYKCLDECACLQGSRFVLIGCVRVGSQESTFSTNA